MAAQAHSSIKHQHEIYTNLARGVVEALAGAADVPGHVVWLLWNEPWVGWSGVQLRTPPTRVGAPFDPGFSRKKIPIPSLVYCRFGDL
jgi:hypothetical protein